MSPETLFKLDDVANWIALGVWVLGNLAVLLLFLWWGGRWLWRKLSPGTGKRKDSEREYSPERYPCELEGAVVEKSEAWISCLDPVPLHGRLDKAYLLKDGSILLVDTKTGGAPRVMESDRIQLSVYATIVRRLIKKPGHPVRDYGYIRHVGPGGVRWLRVNLMPEKEIVWLWNAWHRAKQGLQQPVPTRNPGLCKRCGHLSVCPSSAANTK